jgi:hypothetical protein
MPLLPFEKPGADSLGDSCRSLAPRPLIFTVAILRATHGTTGASGSALKDAWFVTALHLPVIRNDDGSSGPTATGDRRPVTTCLRAITWLQSPRATRRLRRSRSHIAEWLCPRDYAAHI